MTQKRRMLDHFPTQDGDIGTGKRDKRDEKSINAHGKTRHIFALFAGIPPQSDSFEMTLVDNINNGV